MSPPRGHPAIRTSGGYARVRLSRPELPPLEQFVETLSTTWADGSLSNSGPQTRALEAAFARFSRARGQSFATANCDIALTLSVAALGLPPGGHALVPSFGHPSTVNALQWNGLRPRFVDVDSADWCLHPEQIDGELDGVSLIVSTHMFGVPCDAEGLERLAATRGIKLVFDAAHAAASWIGGRHVVDFGDASAVSLGATKIITCGEGGIAVLRDRSIAQRFEQLRTYGSDRDGVSRQPGMNAKMSELHGALAVLALDGLEERVLARRRLCRVYAQLLGPVDEVRLQHVPANVQVTPSYLAVDLGRSRDGVRAALAARDVDTRVYFPPLHLMPRFRGTPHAPLPVTERLGRSLLALPLYSTLSAGEVEDICAIVADCAAGSHS